MTTDMSKTATDVTAASIPSQAAPSTTNPVPAPITPGSPAEFRFDGGAGTFVGTALLGAIITVLTLGIMYPFAVVLMERWRAKHSMINGVRMQFTGSAWGLFGRWLLWLLLIIVTLGIYSFWVVPRINRWKWEHRTLAW